MQQQKNSSTYEVRGILGKGSYGTCYKVRSKSSQYEFVMKAVGLTGLSQEERAEAFREAKILQSVKHQNIVAYKESWNDQNQLYLIMEYCKDGDLLQLMKRNFEQSTIDEELAWHYIVQIMMGLNYIHNKNVLHRDLKPSNVFLDGPRALLGDFGLATAVNSASRLARTKVGTPLYFSPELCTGSAYGLKSDMWALGCVVYELLTGQPPFMAVNELDLAQKVLRDEPPPLPSYYSQNMRSLIALLLQKQPERRPDTSALLSNAFVARKVKLATRLIRERLNPSQTTKQQNLLGLQLNLENAGPDNPKGQQGNAMSSAYLSDDTHHSHTAQSKDIRTQSNTSEQADLNKPVKSGVKSAHVAAGGGVGPSRTLKQGTHLSGDPGDTTGHQTRGACVISSDNPKTVSMSDDQPLSDGEQAPGESRVVHPGPMERAQETVSQPEPQSHPNPATYSGKFITYNNEVFESGRNVRADRPKGHVAHTLAEAVAASSSNAKPTAPMSTNATIDRSSATPLKRAFSVLDNSHVLDNALEGRIVAVGDGGGAWGVTVDIPMQWCKAGRYGVVYVCGAKDEIANVAWGGSDGGDATVTVKAVLRLKYQVHITDRNSDVERVEYCTSILFALDSPMAAKPSAAQSTVQLKVTGQGNASEVLLTKYRSATHAMISKHFVKIKRAKHSGSSTNARSGGSGLEEWSQRKVSGHLGGADVKARVGEAVESGQCSSSGVVGASLEQIAEESSGCGVVVGGGRVQGRSRGLQAGTEVQLKPGKVVAQQRGKDRQQQESGQQSQSGGEREMQKAKKLWTPGRRPSNMLSDSALQHPCGRESAAKPVETKVAQSSSQQQLGVSTQQLGFGGEEQGEGRGVECDKKVDAVSQMHDVTNGMGHDDSNVPVCDETQVHYDKKLVIEPCLGNAQSGSQCLAKSKQQVQDAQNCTTSTANARGRKPYRASSSKTSFQQSGAQDKPYIRPDTKIIDEIGKPFAESSIDAKLTYGLSGSHAKQIGRNASQNTSVNVPDTCASTKVSQPQDQPAKTLTRQRAGHSINTQSQHADQQDSRYHTNKYQLQHQQANGSISDQAKVSKRQFLMQSTSDTSTEQENTTRAPTATIGDQNTYKTDMNYRSTVFGTRAQHDVVHSSAFHTTQQPRVHTPHSNTTPSQHQHLTHHLLSTPPHEATHLAHAAHHHFIDPYRAEAPHSPIRDTRQRAALCPDPHTPDARTTRTFQPQHLKQRIMTAPSKMGIGPPPLYPNIQPPRARYMRYAAIEQERSDASDSDVESCNSHGEVQSGGVGRPEGVGPGECGRSMEGGGDPAASLERHREQLAVGHAGRRGVRERAYGDVGEYGVDGVHGQGLSKGVLREEYGGRLYSAQRGDGRSTLDKKWVSQGDVVRSLNNERYNVGGRGAESECRLSGQGCTGEWSYTQGVGRAGERLGGGLATRHDPVASNAVHGGSDVLYRYVERYDAVLGSDSGACARCIAGYGADVHQQGMERTGGNSGLQTGGMESPGQVGLKQQAKRVGGYGVTQNVSTCGNDFKGRPVGGERGCGLDQGDDCVMQMARSKVLAELRDLEAEQAGCVRGRGKEKGGRLDGAGITGGGGKDGVYGLTESSVSDGTAYTARGKGGVRVGTSGSWEGGQWDEGYGKENVAQNSVQSGVDRGRLAAQQYAYGDKRRADEQGQQYHTATHGISETGLGQNVNCARHTAWDETVSHKQSYSSMKEQCEAVGSAQCDRFPYRTNYTPATQPARAMPVGTGASPGHSVSHFTNNPANVSTIAETVPAHQKYGYAPYNVLLPHNHQQPHHGHGVQQAPHSPRALRRSASPGAAVTPTAATRRSAFGNAEYADQRRLVTDTAFYKRGLNLHRYVQHELDRGQRVGYGGQGVQGGGSNKINLPPKHKLEAIMAEIRRKEQQRVSGGIRRV